jgi:hypothetical protein
MSWVWLTVDVLLLCGGIVLLLHAYRVIGKRPGEDEKYDAAMARSSVINKWLGWCIVAIAIIGLLEFLSGGLL